MSDRTSHRRRARRRRVAEARAHVEAAYVQMCEQCHGHPANRQFGDLLVCSDCRAKFPVLQPWRIDPESDKYIDTRTGKVLQFPTDGAR